jgi:endonuclease/exonuclease/phosphatase family metal-dependent hydrolase
MDRLYPREPNGHLRIMLTKLAPLLALASVPLLTACQPTMQSRSSEQSASSDTVRIATWNLEHLAEANGEGCRPRTDSDYEDLRQHAQRLNADVVALQEVENERAAARVFPSDRWVILMSSRPGSARSSQCRGSASNKILRQAVGFAIRKGIPFKRNGDVSELGLSDPDLRWGVDVTLQLPTPLRLLTVHLKSGCNAGRDPSDQDCDVLFRQAPVLEAWVDERARTGEHFAVLGDWNRRTGLGEDAFLGIVSDDDPPQGLLIMATAGRQATCISRYTDYIDHIAVGLAANDRLVPNSFTEYRYGEDESRFPSDHCPQSVEVLRR